MKSFVNSSSTPSGDRVFFRPPPRSACRPDAPPHGRKNVPRPAVRRQGGQVVSTRKLVAAGGIVWRPTKTGIELLLVHRPGYKDWTFAKGKLDTGESLRDCARREVEEETGFVCIMGPRLGAIEYTTSRGELKEVHYWSMHPVDGTFKPNREVDKIAWLRPKDALRRLTYPRDREFLTELGTHWWILEPRVFLVRHAHAGDRSAWKGKDSKRPLTDKGRRQADGIANKLKNEGVTGILSSPAARCVQTVEPLANLLGVEIETHPALAEGVTATETVSLIHELGDSRTVLVTHGDVVFGALEHLAEQGTNLKPPVVAKKASTWVLHPEDDGTIGKGLYLPPPHA